MKKIIIFLVFSALCALELPAQIVFTAGVNYTTGVPSGAPGSNGSRLRVDLLTGKLYEWSPTSMTWLALGQGVDKVSGCATPSYTPGIGQSDFVVNECTPTPQLFHYRAGVWRQIGGSPYTAGDGISIASNVITNTGDLDPTNELNASLTVVGNSLTLVDEGGFLTVPVSDIAPVQSVTAGTGISVSSTAGVATVANTGDTNAGDDVTGSGATPNLAYWVGTQTQAAASAAFWDNTNGRLGIGSSLPDAKLRVISTGNDIAANFTGTYTLTGSMSPTRFDYTLNPSTAHTGLFTAASYVIRPTGAQAKGLVVAQYNVITDPGAGAITAAYCSRNEIAPNGGGAIAASYITDNSAYNNSATANGIVVGLRNTIGGNYTTAYGAFTEITSGGAFTPVNAYGFYAGAINSSSANRFGFYSFDANAKTYFRGKTGIGSGTTTPSAYLHVVGDGASSSTFGLLVEKSDGGNVLETRDDGKISVNGDSYNEVLNVNGQVRADAVDIRDWSTTDNTNTGEVHFESGGGSNFGYLTVGDGERRFPITPTNITLQAVDFDVAWTSGRTKAFWTVPARYNGWKIYSVTLMVSTIGTGTNTVETEKGGVAQATTSITAASHRVVLGAALATDDIWTWDITAVSGTPTKGLFIEIILLHN